MELHKMKNILSILVLFLSLSAFSQRLSDPNVIKNTAHQQLEIACQSEGDIFVFAKENALNGSLEVEYVIKDNGKVVTLNTLSAEGLSVPQKNTFKSFLYNRKFDIKTTKKSTHQFTYTFNFN